MNALLLVLAACRGPALPEPSLEAVEPDLVWNGEQQPITIVGDNFFPQIAIDPRTGAALVNPTYRAFLVGPAGAGGGRAELLGVGVKGEHELSATVDEGLAPGTYDVVVEGPTGLTASLSAGLSVTDQEAVRLQLTSADRSYAVSEEAAVQLQLVDAEDVVVPLDLEVVVTVDSSVKGNVITLHDDADAAPSPDDQRVWHGWIRDGEATVFLRSQLPDDDLQVSAAPWDTSSPVLTGHLELSFEPGTDLRVELALPASPLPGPAWPSGDTIDVTARLVDQYGNPVETPDDGVLVLLQTTCSGWAGSAVLKGATVIPVAPENVCPRDRLRALAPFPGRSAKYQVVPGRAAYFTVDAQQDPVRAGDTVDVVAFPSDVNDNPTAYEGTATLEDSEGGLVSATCNVLDRTIACSGVVTLAGPAVTFTVRGDDGTTGVSGPIEVVADDVPVSLALEATGPAIAGEPLQVLVRGLDAWSNVMDGATLGAVTVTDDLGDAVCVWSSVEPDGAQGFACTFEVARPDAELTARLDAAALEARAEVDVENGPLALVAFTAPATAIAGTPVAAQVAGSDAFGNPYVVQSDPVVLLSDDSGTFSQRRVTLNAGGTAPVVGTFTRAGTTHLIGSQGGVELGQSAPILVAPGETDALRVTPTEPWGWLGTAMDVQVESVDAYDNRTDETLAAQLASLDTASPGVQVNLVNGVGASAFTWSEAAWPDRLEATGGAWSGQTLLLVARVCAPSPTAVLDFGGFPEAVACVDGDGTAPIVADLAPSVQATAPLVAFGVSVNGAPSEISGQAAVLTRLPSVGRHEVRGLVVDNQGCGSEASADGWAGPDDGTPVGPIPLASTAAQLPVQGLGVTPLTIAGVVDCARDPASFGVVQVRATAGTVASMLPNVVTPSGAGPEIELDVNGDFTGSWDTNYGISAAVASVVAWTDNGAASGVLERPIVGDSVRPVVFGSDPSGFGAGPVSEIALAFSEPLLPGSLTTAVFTVSGPSVVAAAATLTAEDEVTLALSPPLDRDLGAYTITVPSQIRDRAGNRLAGTWQTSASVNPAPWTGGVGGAGAPPAAVSCVAFDPPSVTFRPDGDDGAGEEADVFAIHVSAAVAPAWWVLQVRDGAGALVVEGWTVPVAADDTVEWNGRDFHGVVVDDGSYTVTVEPDDGLGNRGMGCASIVVVDALPRGVP